MHSEERNTPAGEFLVAYILSIIIVGILQASRSTPAAGRSTVCADDEEQSDQQHRNTPTGKIIEIIAS